MSNLIHRGRDEIVNGIVFRIDIVRDSRAHLRRREVYYEDGKRISRDGWFEDRRAAKDAEWAREDAELLRRQQEENGR